MSTEITANIQTPSYKPDPVLPSKPAHTAEKKPEISTAKLAVPDKADLQFDAEQMQKNLQEAIARLNAQMKSKGQQLNFSIDKTIDRTVIQVKNSETGELIRQIPDETLLRVAHNIEQVKGMLLDEQS